MQAKWQSSLLLDRLVNGIEQSKYGNGLAILRLLFRVFLSYQLENEQLSSCLNTAPISSAIAIDCP